MDKSKKINDLFLVRVEEHFLEQWNKVLVDLYQPFLGVLPTMLYITLKTMHARKEPLTHHQLIAQTHIEFEQLTHLFEKLEAAALITTYRTLVDGITLYIYHVNSPMTQTEFLKEPMFSRVLASHIGQDTLKTLQAKTNSEKMNSSYINEIYNISAKFKDVFKEELCGLDEKAEMETSMNYKIVENEAYFFDTFYLMLPATMRESFEFTRTMKQLLNQIATVHGLNSGQMAMVFNTVAQQSNGTITEQALRQVAYKLTVSILRKEKPVAAEQSNETKTVSGVRNEQVRRALLQMKSKKTLDYIAMLTDNVTPMDVITIEQLLIDYQLPEEVLNVMVDYVYKTNQTLAKPLMVAIAQEWSKKGIKTAEEAYKALSQFAKKAKKRQEDKQTKKTNGYSKKRTEIIPVFDQTEAVDDDLKREYEKVLEEMGVK